MPDVTQAAAVVGIREGLFADSLGRGVAIRPVRFTTDSAEAAALASGKLDAAYASPDTILAVLATRHAGSIVVISGASAAGAELVVSRRLGGPSALRGHTLAIPATGDAQDIALRRWLGSRHLAVGTHDGVAVTAIPQGPAVIAAFKTGRIVGALEPAPVDLELAATGGRALTGRSGPSVAALPTANLVVTRKFLDAIVEREGGRKPLVARYGGIPLRQQKKAVIQDRQPGRATGPKELVTRLRANRCEICERSGNVEVHHIRKLADLDKSGHAGRPAWAAIMARRRRKSLVVCLDCHAGIHNGKPATKITD